MNAAIDSATSRPRFTLKLKPTLRGVLLSTLAVVVIVSGTYLFSRIRSLGRAVDIERLEAFEPQQSFDGALRIGSYNIAHGRGGTFGAANWDGGVKADKIHRLQEIGSVLAESEIDIVVLNEVDFASIWSGHLDQAEIVATAGGYPFVVRQRSFDVSIPFAHAVFGNAILSRFPVVEAVWEEFEPFSRWEKLALGNHDSVLARIQLPDESVIAVWGVHLEVRGEPLRLKAARRILERATRIVEPLFVVGDLNSRLEQTTDPTVDSETAVSLLIGSGRFQPFPRVAELARFPTFPSERPDRTIDWILFPSDWHLIEGFVGSAPLSDHLPIGAAISR